MTSTTKATWADNIANNISNDTANTSSNNNSNIHTEENTHTILTNLCSAFSEFPFMVHNDLVVALPESGTQIQCTTDMSNKLIGNVRYSMLHGGVTATMLDSIGGVQTMVELILRGIKLGDDMSAIMKQISKVATLDLRVDYLLPGKGNSFIATAEIIRLGRKSCTARMQLHNDSNKLIAIATASYVY